MQIKTITYQRVLSLGNYESKRLEMTAEVEPFDNLDAATETLMKIVERKIREEKEVDIVARIKTLEEKASNLRQEISYLEEKLSELKNEQDKLTPLESSDNESINDF
ncbi:hypothetical protein IQ244_28735 [Nostoc sp. LEGE 06077]|uniref:hypothetical protein n=1 Tax=Nostoc sp. LEGE 06077 TaxID=915325 RepID=UPI00187F82C8|nr:hypothetical protein [Nostoc sp. LEGE 06077]MBE9210420.1 hypothetical protein [Nostoc sp. LEGE 06077]